MLTRIYSPIVRLYMNSPKIGVINRCIHNSPRQEMLFEGNIIGIGKTEEERMGSIFGGRLKGEPPKSTSRIIVGQSKKIAGIDVPMKPQEPDNCCMSGCINCVWELYNDDVRYWRKQRKLAAEDIAMSNEIWPADWDPPLTAIPMKNVPGVLRKQKLKMDKQVETKKMKSRDEVRSLFPKRESPLPKAVLEARAKNQQLHSSTPKKDILENEDDGWGDVPVHIKAFAEFERKKHILAKENKIKRRRANPLLAQLIKQEEEYANKNKTV
ncbi:similar to Saccharomyces cerevisiae YPL107W Putative protein of unknown function [Maudiozyma saulgeensis]|uniref:Oxidoreductase-like domain-containing protein n=1 Tax=Maudiozyma saulgeensis TaxID=1789683 RepID=A0A1X7R685_9SACH|nr:similar to Saccharomyces cerevisiae YPL107W Putative protein of unknown function [Kazachstania saulgeensis]